MVNEDVMRQVLNKCDEHFSDNSLLKITDDEMLRKRITEHVIRLLLYNMEKLLQVLYRVDIDEQKVKSAFAQQDPQLIAPALAELIIQRELQKAETRIRYR
jgi:hypothetical protein